MKNDIEKAIVEILSENKVKPIDLVNIVISKINPNIKPTDIEELIFNIRECIWSLIIKNIIYLEPNRELTLIKNAQ